MKIELKEITVKGLTEGCQDNNESGVVGFGGKLDIRPPYQREFICKDKQRDAVINTVRRDFPLNVMYWAVPTTQPRGTKAARQRPKIANYCVKTTTAGNLENSRCVQSRIS